MLQKNKRRSKKDKTGRNYICGCGKNYLSYPALYTHIKNKHEGKAPEGTTLQPATRVKPGRPPKRADSPSKRSDQDGSGNDDDENQTMRSSERRSLSNLEFTPIKTLDDRIKHSTLRKDMLSKDELTLLRELKCEGTASPTRSFVKERNLITNQFILHPIADMLNCLKSEAADNEFFTQLTCDKIFACYLDSLAKFANQTFHNMVALIVRALRQCLNDHGYDLLQLFEAQNPTQKIELLKESTETVDVVSFCKVEPAWYISIVFDFFVKEYLPRYLDGEDFNLAFVSGFLQAFNDWLLTNNLSKVKCTFFSYYK